MLIKNDLVVEDVISVLFTATPDLTSAFPAKFAREIGFGVVPLMCASEIAVPGAMSRVIRIMMHVESTVALNQVQHVYLRDAVALRDDLAR
jgi:chorismate mutase